MVLARWQATIVDDEGDIQPDASVEVRRETGGAPLASIFSDRDGNDALGNPMTADSEGFAAFHVAGGAYRITATKNGFSRVWRYVGIGLLSEQDEAPPDPGALQAAGNLSDVGDAEEAFGNIKQDATDEATGVVRLATVEEAETGTDTESAVTPAGVLASIAENASGDVPARAYAEYTANADISTTIPLDDTIPQQTEGTEILSAEITLQRSDSRVRATFSGQAGVQTDANMVFAIAALFKDSAANALRATYATIFIRPGGSQTEISDVLSLVHEHAPGDVGPHTYKIRVGGNTGTIRLNGSEDAGRRLGGASAATLVLEEVFV